MRIIYLGTPDFAVEPLRRLVEAGKNIVAVVTMPDKPAGRGHKLLFSPVKEYALGHGLPVLQPVNLKDEAFLAELRSYRADLQIVVAFRMLPEVVWAMPPLGTFNLHASLLPEYRGAAPINWAVINGDRETGVTTFFMKHEIDTGNIIMQERVSISDSDDAGTVHDRLMMLGGDVVLRTVERIEQGNVTTTPQPEQATRPAPKIFKETCHLSFDQPVARLHNYVRGFAPYPAAWIALRNTSGDVMSMKIMRSEAELQQHNHPVGTLLTDDKTYLKIATSDGFLHLIEVQLAGKRRMPIADLLRGTHLADWTVDTPIVPRLALRPWTDADAPRLYRLASDPLVGIPAGWPPHDSVEFSREIISRYFSSPMVYAVVLRATDEIIGCVGLTPFTKDGMSEQEAVVAGKYELSYWLGVSYWGLGYATEAVEMLLHESAGKLNKAWLCYYADNCRSARVAEKCGFSVQYSRPVNDEFATGKEEICTCRTGF